MPISAYPPPRPLRRRRRRRAEGSARRDGHAGAGDAGGTHGACKGLGAQLLEDPPALCREAQAQRARPPADVALASLDHVYSHAGDPLAAAAVRRRRAGAGIHHAVRQRPRDEPVQPRPGASRHRPRRQARLPGSGDRRGRKSSSPARAAATAMPSSRKTSTAGRTFTATCSASRRGWARCWPGRQVGHLGSTGHSTGPHVHYEVRNSRGTHINPVTLLFPGRGVGKGYAWLDVRQQGRPARVVAGIAGQPRPR